GYPAAQHIRLKLHESGVVGSSPVGAEHFKRYARPLFNKLNGVPNLVSNALDRGPNNMGSARPPAHPGYHRPGLRLPVWRAQPDKGRNKVNTFIMMRLKQQLLQLGKSMEQAQVIANP